MGGQYSSTISGSTFHDPDPNKNALLDHGIYLGVVKNNKDAFLSGTCDVEITALFRTGGKGVKITKPCRFASPFAGISDPELIDKDKTESYEGTQQSYGMWFGAPDINSLVLVAFADGNRKHGYIISQVMQPQFNHMVPGIPAGKSFQGGKFLTPVAEKNKYSEQEGHNDIVRPIHHDLAEAITKQGLINDKIRGAGTAGARRDTPSQVYGILTKGSRGTDGKTPSQAGHQFILDDDPETAMIRLRSGKGQQILLDDATGTIYAINKDGKAWVELDFNGNINIFGEGDMNLRAKKNFNLRADYDINIEAGQNIRMKAAGDNVAGDYTGETLAKLGLGPSGSGGNINFHAAADVGILASRNAQLSAIGGDIDANSGGMIKTHSGLGTAISATTMGVNISAKAGTIGITSPLSVGISGGTDVGIAGAQLRLNTPAGEEVAAKIKAEAFDALKVSAPPLDGVDQEDQPSNPPEYDREGPVALTSGGERPGGRPTISSIVGNLITAEPYDGHAQFDPTSEDKESMEEDTTADAETLPGQTNAGDDDPQDENTPEGTKLGNGFKDAASGAVGKATDLKNAIGNGLDAAGSAIGNAIGSVMGAIPNLENVQGMLSNFLPASMKDLMGIQNMDGLLAAFGIAIPAFRFPTGNAQGDKIIGLAKQMKELEARLGQFSLDQFDLPIDMNGFDVKELKGKVLDAVNEINELKSKADELKNIAGGLQTEADKLRNSGNIFNAIDPESGEAMGSMGINSGNFKAVQEKLSEKGIDLAVDGPSLIFTDRKTGTKVVDVSNGIGPVGLQMGIRSEMQQSKKDISQLITVPVSDNQLLALTSFANHIGTKNFANSEALVALNEGRYYEVPKFMRRWRTGKVGRESDVQVRQDYVQRREYEIELYSTPDWLGLTQAEMGLAGPDKNLSFRQLRALLRNAKQRKYIELGYKVPQ